MAAHAPYTVITSEERAALRVAHEQAQLGKPADEREPLPQWLEEGADNVTVEPHWSQLPGPEDETTGGTVWRYTCRASLGALYVVDAVGEWLASALGITTPRYQYIIDDLVMQQREALEERQEVERQIAEREREEGAKAVAMEAAGGESGPQDEEAPAAPREDSDSTDV